MDLPNDIEGNYEQLRKQRGWDYETLADSLEATDPRLAAYFRAKAYRSDDEPAATDGGDTLAAGDEDAFVEFFKSVGQPLTDAQVAALREHIATAAATVQADALDEDAVPDPDQSALDFLDEHENHNLGQSIADEAAAGQARTDALTTPDQEDLDVIPSDNPNEAAAERAAADPDPGNIRGAETPEDATAAKRTSKPRGRRASADSTTVEQS